MSLRTVETYILRIYRRREEGELPVLTGVVENADDGRKRRFADAAALLRILEIGERQRPLRARPERRVNRRVGR